MAFFNKLGATLRQNISVSSSMNAQSAMLNAIRCMSSRLFVGGLSHGTDYKGLKDAFSSFGDVTEARVIIDRDSGKSRRLGFVSFADDECANSALSAMDGQDLNGSAIRVSLAQVKAPRSSYGGGAGGGGGFRGGYGNGGRKMRSLLSNRTNTNTFIESVKIKSAYQSASLIAQDVSFQLRTKRTRSFRSIFSKVVKNIPLVMKKRVKGIRICCSGRLKGAKIARTECGKYGKISRNVLNHKIDYAPAEVSTRYGNLGVKVWISYSQKRMGRSIS